MEINVRRSAGAIKLYANVPSRSRNYLNHLVTYFRQPGVAERWTCTCEDQAMNRTAKRQNCFHIKQVKSQGTVKANGRPILSTFAA